MLVLLAVIFVPMLFEDALQHEGSFKQAFPLENSLPDTASPKSVSIPPAPVPTVPRIPLPSAWAIQVGSFSSPENAKALVVKLKAKGFAAFIVPPAAADKPLYRVRVGPVLEKERAASMSELIQKQMGLKGFVVPHS